MKKAEYIERYGLEAYNTNLENIKRWKRDHAEKCKEYQKKYHASEKGKHASKLKDAKRSLKAGVCGTVDNIARKACCDCLHMTQKEFVKWRKSVGYSFHHAFGLTRPDEGVLLPNYAHRELHSMYGKSNDSVTIERLADYCTIHNIHFIVISKYPLLGLSK